MLIEAAGPVFARKGLAETTAGDVAAAAGLPVQAVREHFDSPEELLLEVLTSQVEGRLAEAAWLAEGSPTSRPDAAAALSRLLITVADKDVDTAGLNAELWLRAIREPSVMRRLAARSKRFEGMLGMVIQSRFARLDPGLDVPVEAMATVLGSLFDGMVQRRRQDPAAVPDELFGQALQWFINGVRATAARPQEPDQR
jgi:AcrR family transcriptional regulator